VNVPPLAASGFALENLFQVAVVVLFFIAPAIKGILQSQKKRVGVRGPADEKRERRAREQWERLLRGQLPEPAEPEPSKPQPARTVAPQMQREAPKPLTKASRPEPVLAPVESVAPAEPLAPAAPVRRRHAPASATAGVAPLLAELPSAAPAKPAAAGAALALRDRPRSRYGVRLPAPGLPRGGTSWRRAVVLSEVLGLPLALRRDAPWMGRP